MQESSFARDFDQPYDSPAHQFLATTVWMGGPFVTIPFWLGRRIGRNLFREEHEVVQAHLRTYFIQQGWSAASILVEDISSWDSIALVLQFQEQGLPESLTTNDKRNVLALAEFLKEPDVTDEELAARLGTTPKQIARTTSVGYLRRLLKDACDG
jgi:hypothetical protein